MTDAFASFRPGILMGILMLLAGCDAGPPRASSHQNQPQAPNARGDQAILPGAVAFSYTVADEAGQSLAYGTLIIPWPLNENQDFRGTWQARPVLLPVSDKPSESPKIGPQLGGGQLAGHCESNSLRLNLNPNMADNNVIFIAQIEGGSLQGRWEYSTFTGLSNQGLFRAQRQN